MKEGRITIDDIARLAKVSKATVSRVLNNPSLVNGAKKEAVLAALGQTKFQPNLMARSLASGQSMTIGIVTQNIGTSFYDDIIRSIILGLRQTNYKPIFGDGLFEQNAEVAAVKTLLDRKVDGIILLGGDISGPDLQKLVGDRPVVVVAREGMQWQGTIISADNFQLGYEATRCLINHGHTEIAHVTGNPLHQDSVRRTNGYRQALSDAGIEVDPELIYQGNFYGQAGVLAVESWLMRGKNFSAVFAANDLTAFGVRLALSRRNIRVPDEVSLIGIDDQVESALVAPPLTSIRQPAAEMGQAAAKAILELIAGSSSESRVYQGKVIIRESVSAKR
jgi:LacI family transcriptional regulator